MLAGNASRYSCGWAPLEQAEEGSERMDTVAEVRLPTFFLFAHDASIRLLAGVGCGECVTPVMMPHAHLTHLLHAQTYHRCSSQGSAAVPSAAPLLPERRPFSLRKLGHRSVHLARRPARCTSVATASLSETSICDLCMIVSMSCPTCRVRHLESRGAASTLGATIPCILPCRIVSEIIPEINTTAYLF